MLPDHLQVPPQREKDRSQTLPLQRSYSLISHQNKPSNINREIVHSPLSNTTDDLLEQKLEIELFGDLIRTKQSMRKKTKKTKSKASFSDNSSDSDSNSYNSNSNGSNSDSDGDSSSSSSSDSSIELTEEELHSLAKKKNKFLNVRQLLMEDLKKKNQIQQLKHIEDSNPATSDNNNNSNNNNNNESNRFSSPDNLTASIMDEEERMLKQHIQKMKHDYLKYRERLLSDIQNNHKLAPTEKCLRRLEKKQIKLRNSNNSIPNPNTTSSTPNAPNASTSSSLSTFPNSLSSFRSTTPPSSPSDSEPTSPLDSPSFGKVSPNLSTYSNRHHWKEPSTTTRKYSPTITKRTSLYGTQQMNANNSLLTTTTTTTDPTLSSSTKNRKKHSKSKSRSKSKSSPSPSSSSPSSPLSPSPTLQRNNNNNNNNNSNDSERINSDSNNNNHSQSSYLRTSKENHSLLKNSSSFIPKGKTSKRIHSREIKRQLESIFQELCLECGLDGQPMGASYCARCGTNMKKSKDYS